MKNQIFQIPILCRGVEKRLVLNFIFAFDGKTVSTVVLQTSLNLPKMFRNYFKEFVDVFQNLEKMFVFKLSAQI